MKMRCSRRRTRLPLGHDTVDIPLRKTFDTFSGMCLVVGLMIGSGIFSTPGKVLMSVGSPGMAMVIWAVGGIITFCGTFSYIELGTMMPESGGEQVYLQTSYSRPRDLMPFLFCWVMILCIRPGSEAADCIVVSKYIMFPFNSGLNQNVVQQRLIAMAAISLITAINISNTRIAILIHDVITVLKIAVVTIIALTGVLIAVQLVKIDNRPNNFAHPFAGTDNRPGSYASACFRVFFAYDGWNNLNYSVAELKDPEKCLPRASAMGVGLVTILFLAANFAYFTVVPLDKIVSSSELLAGQFFIAVFGDFVGSKIFPVLLAMSALGAVSAMAFSASRIILASAKAGIIPKSEYLSAVHPYFKTPTRAFILNWALSMILIAIPPSEDAFDFLLELVGYPQWVFYGLAVVGLLLLRIQQPNRNRPFSVWLPLPFIFIVTCIFLSVFPFVSHHIATFPYYLPPLLGILAILSGIPAWALCSKLKKNGMGHGAQNEGPKTSTTSMESSTERNVTIPS